MECDNDSYPVRKWLHHETPSWVRKANFFITICCANREKNFLCSDDSWKIFMDAIRFYHNERWFVHLWLNMPDHAHAILSFPQTEDMNKVIVAFKRYTAREANINWQKGFFDHRLRTNKALNEKMNYIRMNPVRKNLISEPDQWPFKVDTADIDRVHQGEYDSHG